MPLNHLDLNPGFPFMKLSLEEGYLILGRRMGLPEPLLSRFVMAQKHPTSALYIEVCKQILEVDPEVTGYVRNCIHAHKLDDSDFLQDSQAVLGETPQRELAIWIWLMDANGEVDLS